jgi:hypothetical protein
MPKNKKPNRKTKKTRILKPASLSQCLESEHNSLMFKNRNQEIIAVMTPAYIGRELKYMLIDMQENVIKTWDDRELAMIQSHSLVQNM